MDYSRVAFKGTLQQLLEKVERGEVLPKFQVSHAPPCKFWTAFQVINGLRHMAPVIHGPTGRTYSVASAYKINSCEYRGVPLELTSCTAQDKADVVYLPQRVSIHTTAQVITQLRQNIIRSDDIDKSPIQD